MELPIILINFKCYTEGTGKNALKLARICEDVSKKYKVNIVISPQITDIQIFSKKFKIPIFAQHIDPVEIGAFTGHVTALAVKEAGAVGTIINHAEKKLPLRDIEKCIQLARKYELVSVVCAESLMSSKDIAILNPDFISYEDPMLIGTGNPISRVKPKDVKSFVEMVNRINPKITPLCGAGISSGEDAKIALELGTKGMIISSAVVKADNPRQVLEDIAKKVRI